MTVLAALMVYFLIRLKIYVQINVLRENLLILFKKGVWIAIKVVNRA